MERLILSDWLKRDLRDGYIARNCINMRHGLRRILRLWFNPASGHYVADAGGVFLWSENGGPRWTVVTSQQAK